MDTMAAILAIVLPLRRDMSPSFYSVLRLICNLFSKALSSRHLRRKYVIIWCRENPKGIYFIDNARKPFYNTNHAKNEQTAANAFNR